MPADHQQGLIDTNVVILRSRIDADRLPRAVAISTVTLAELSAGVQLVRGRDVGARAERARRAEILQRTESEFDPIPFDVDAARAFGRVSAAIADGGRSPRRRTADLLIAATAAAAGLPLYTANPRDFIGLRDVVEVVAVPFD